MSKRKRPKEIELKNSTLFSLLLKYTITNFLYWGKIHEEIYQYYAKQTFSTNYNNNEYVLFINYSKGVSGDWHYGAFLMKNGIKINSKMKKDKYLNYCIKLYKAIIKNNKILDIKTLIKNKYGIDKIENQISSKNIELKDFVVRTNIFKCISDKHTVEEIIGIIKVLKPNGNIYEEKVTAAYCSSCHCYFLMKSEYDRIHKQGILLCRMIERVDFLQSGIYSWYGNKESILMRCGYNVKANVGLTDI